MGVYIRANSCEQLDREIRVAVNTVKYLLFFLMGCFLFLAEGRIISRGSFGMNVTTKRLFRGKSEFYG